MKRLQGEEESSVDEAESSFFAELQRFIVPRSKKPNLPSRLKRICCVDVGYVGRRAISVASLFEDGKERAVSIYRGSFTFPYVSGLMYLHEGPFVVEAVRSLDASSRPQLVCFDAHGLAHPRLAGLALTCGVILGIPSIGIAKTLLVGTTVKYKQGIEKIVYDGSVVGFTTSLAGKHRYWSQGYSVTLKDLESIILRYGQICLKAMDESHRLSKSEALS